METRQGSMLQSLRNVDTFLDQHADVLTGVAQSGARRKLSEAIAALATHVATQAGSIIVSQGATQKHYALRQALVRDHMTPIARIAAAELPRTPELAPLRMPRGEPAAESLAAAAYGMAQAAATHADVFIDAGLDNEFVERLNAAAGAMLHALDERASSRSVRRGATKALKNRLSAGRKLVHVLDAFVRSALVNDPELLAAWNVTQRVRVVATGRSNSDSVSALPMVPALVSSAEAA